MQTLSHLTDQLLVNLFISGNTHAFDQLVQRHKQSLYTAVFVLVRDKFLSEDLLQDVFIKIITSIREGRYNEEGKFLPWALRIARNHCLDHIRLIKRSRHKTAVEYEDGIRTTTYYEESSEVKLIKTQKHNQIKNMVRWLPKDQRSVIMYRHYNDMSFKEIAALTNCSINTALGRMRYGLLKLRKMMLQSEFTLD